MRRRISDPRMGGAYLTLLNTVANIGVTVPKLLVFAGTLCTLCKAVEVTHQRLCEMTILG